MIRDSALRVVVLGLVACTAAALRAEEKAPPGGAPSEFVPPSGAKAAQRVGGFASRCSDDPALYASVLAPAATVGVATSEQPTLYWYLSKATKDPVEIAINDLNDKANPVLELSLDGVAEAGLQKLDLAKHGARLAPGGEYELVIEVITSEDAGSRNATAVCRIARPPAGRAPAEAAPPAGLSKPDVAAFHAKRGAWFDYIAALLAAVNENPKDKSLLTRLGASLKREKLIWNEDGSIDEPGTETK